MTGEVTQSNKCVPCMRGYYSIDPTKMYCDHCVDKATCPGGTELLLNNGTWRNMTDNKAIKIYDCLVEEACK